MTAMQIDCGVIIATSKPWTSMQTGPQPPAQIDDALRNSPGGPYRKLSSRSQVPASTNGSEVGHG
jgi:hypothetical protein